MHSFQANVISLYSLVSLTLFVLRKCDMFIAENDVSGPAADSRIVVNLELLPEWTWRFDVLQGCEVLRDVNYRDHSLKGLEGGR